MSNKDRPGKSIAFYTDLAAADMLDEQAGLEHRSVSNMLTVMIREYCDNYMRQIEKVERVEKYLEGQDEHR